MKPLFYRFCLQTEYDDLRIKNEKTLYVTTDTHRIYFGDIRYNAAASSGNVQIDLSNYVTQQQLQTAINNIPSSGSGSTDTSGLLAKISPTNNNYTGKIALIAQGGAAIQASDYTIATSVPANAVFTDTTYNKATALSDGLMSKQHYTKLESNVLTKSDIVICTENEYNNLSIRTASLYFVITSSGLTIKDSLNNDLELGNIAANSGGTAPAANVLTYSSPIHLTNANPITYSNQQTEGEWLAE